VPKFDVVTQRTTRIEAADLSVAAQIVMDAEDGSRDLPESADRGDCEVMAVRKVVRY